MNLLTLILLLAGCTNNKERDLELEEIDEVSNNESSSNTNSSFNGPKSSPVAAIRSNFVTKTKYELQKLKDIAFDGETDLATGIDSSTFFDVFPSLNELVDHPENFSIYDTVADPEGFELVGTLKDAFLADPSSFDMKYFWSDVALQNHISNYIDSSKSAETRNNLLLELIVQIMSIGYFAHSSAEEHLNSDAQIKAAQKFLGNAFKDSFFKDSSDFKIQLDTLKSIISNSSIDALSNFSEKLKKVMNEFEKFNSYNIDEFNEIFLQFLTIDKANTPEAIINGSFEGGLTLIDQVNWPSSYTILDYDVNWNTLWEDNKDSPNYGGGNDPEKAANIYSTNTLLILASLIIDATKSSVTEYATPLNPEELENHNLRLEIMSRVKNLFTRKKSDLIQKVEDLISQVENS